MKIKYSRVLLILALLLYPLSVNADVLCLGKNNKNIFTSKTTKACRKLKGRVLNFNALKGNSGEQGVPGATGESGPSGIINMTYLSDGDEHSVTPDQTTQMVLLLNYGSTFTKLSDETDLLITLTGHGTTTANAGIASIRACSYQIRLNNLTSEGSSSLSFEDTLYHSGSQVIRASLANGESQQSTLSINGLFKSQFFPAGTYTPRIYVRSNLSDTINCSINSGIYNTQVIIQEVKSE